MLVFNFLFFFFFFNHTAPTEIYTLSLHDALPISSGADHVDEELERGGAQESDEVAVDRSEEHTSELQSRGHLVCRLLLEKKKRLRTAGGDEARRQAALQGVDVGRVGDGRE